MWSCCSSISNVSSWLRSAAMVWARVFHSGLASSASSAFAAFLIVIGTIT